MDFMKKIAGFYKNSTGVLTINQRNLQYVYPRNRRKHYPLADNKILTKELLIPAGVPMPETFKIYSNFYELAGLADDLAPHGAFVIKPAKGRVGGGIITISGRRGNKWLGPDEKVYDLYDLKRHISDIIFGVFSYDLHDRAIIEELIVQHQDLQDLSPFGLADVRLIIMDDKTIMPMLRIPTQISGGKSNLHQGALGVGIDPASGVTNNAVWMGEEINRHPDSDVALVGRKLPCWDEIIKIGETASRITPLNYLGIDIGIGEKGPVLLEINVRPGLEIQNINNCGLRTAMAEIFRKDGARP